jgi:hypothetical protein
VVGLDGFELSLTNRMIDSGKLPSLSRIREESARFCLDHGRARETGLASEHVSSGLSPIDAGRWSSVFFNKDNYEVWQEGPLFTPFPSKMHARTVVFDFPYFDLSRVPQVLGAVGWGAHDAGTEFSTNPSNLLDEIVSKYGRYPASQWIYGFAWPSSDRCAAMGNALAQGVAARGKIARWFLKERFPDWKLALIGISESHSALEALWHGVDDQHPLNCHPSSREAAEGVYKVYAAIDQLVGSLVNEFEDAAVLLFSMHGMGPNRSDVPSMVLLPELMHRYAFGRSFFVQPDVWSFACDGVPVLENFESWDVVTPDLRSVAKKIRGEATRIVPAPLKKVLKRILPRQLGRISTNGAETDAVPERRRSLEWMPAARYQPLWSKMPAFALPSFYDGRIRINLQGRERSGLIPRERYELSCREISQLLWDCHDPFRGKPAVEDVFLPRSQDPLGVDASSADLTVNWRENILCLEHPNLGRIGPVPFRRTGGHTGKYGMAYLKSGCLAAGDYGVRCSFDVVPTLFDLLKEQFPEKLSGQSLLQPMIL